MTVLLVPAPPASRRRARACRVAQPGQGVYRRAVRKVLDRGPRLPRPVQSLSQGPSRRRTSLRVTRSSGYLGLERAFVGGPQYVVREHQRRAEPLAVAGQGLPDEVVRARRQSAQTPRGAGERACLRGGHLAVMGDRVASLGWARPAQDLAGDHALVGGRLDAYGVRAEVGQDL